MSKPDSLRWRIVIVLLLAAALPLALTGFGSWIIFGRLLEQRSVETMEAMVLRHAHSIDGYLTESVRLLQWVAVTNSARELSAPGHLRDMAGVLGDLAEGRFADIGVISAEGRHLAYAGPDDLQHREYRAAHWFRQVMDQRTFVSDVFLGYREYPHCIIAVKAVDAEGPWVLRATINSERFDEFVRTGVPGSGSDTFIVNLDGLYQTPPRGGQRLDRYPGQPVYHAGLRDERVTEEGVEKLRVTTWINGGRWALVHEQDLDTIRAPVNQAMADGAQAVLAAVAVLVLATFVATWHLTRRIERANAQREEMSQAFLRSARLASIGELATGLAHEINNPLAIISAEQTNVSDLLHELEGRAEIRAEVMGSVQRCRQQVQRCANITKKMLQFGRRRESTLEYTDGAARIRDTVALMRRRASVRNVGIATDVHPRLPLLYVDPVEFEQVLVNLINNSIDALESGGQIRIRAAQEGARVHIQVLDDGPGIAPEDLAHIFEPFFTTKPVGQGTGLGLAVCYGLVSSWGGEIRAESVPGKGTTMHVYVQARPASGAGRAAAEVARDTQS